MRTNIVSEWGLAFLLLISLISCSGGGGGGGAAGSSSRESLRNGDTTKEEYASSNWTCGNKVVAFHVTEPSCRGKDILWAQPASAKGGCRDSAGRR
jgi:hypothetical protein